jgi:hypothetical protein
MLEKFSSAKGSSGKPGSPYGNGGTSEKILDEILKENWRNFFG